MAATIASSGIYALKDPKAVLTVMLIAIDEGTSLFDAVGDYYIIKGSPGVYSKSLLRRFQERGGLIEWKQTGENGTAEVYGKAVYLPGQPEMTVKYTFDMAEKSNLTRFYARERHQDYDTDRWVEDKGWSMMPAWRNHRPAMLRARALSNLFTMLAPDVFRGRKTVDQLEDRTAVEGQYEVLTNGKPADDGPTLTSTRETPAPETAHSPATDSQPPPESPEPKQLDFDLKDE